MDPVTVLAGVLARDGSELSATETLQQELSRADHLGVLGGIWDDVIRREQAARFEHALCAARCPPTSPVRHWTTRPAPGCGERCAKPKQPGSTAPGSSARRWRCGAMIGARDVARVLDSRVRRMLDGVQPQPFRPWAEGSRDTAPPTWTTTCANWPTRWTTGLAGSASTRPRRSRCGHARPSAPCPATRSPAWTGSSGPASWPPTGNGTATPTPPTRSARRRPRPAPRPAQHGTPPSSALGRVDGIDLRGCTDGDLWLRRGTYERETAWAPPHVAEELRLMRIAERDAHVNAVRAEHESRAARDDQTADRHQQLARTWRALEAKAAAETGMFAAVQDTRRQWETATETTRRIAIAADLELRRRHPAWQIPALRPHPAEAEGVTYPANSAPAGKNSTWVQPTLDGTEHLATHTEYQTERNAAAPVDQREADGRLVLGLTPQSAYEEIPGQVLRIRQSARIAQARLDDMANTPLPGAEEDDLSPGLAWRR